MGQFISSCDSYFLRSMLKRSECARELLTSFRGAIDLTTDGETPLPRSTCTGVRINSDQDRS